MSDLPFCMVLRSLPSQREVKTQAKVYDICWNKEVQFLYFKSIISIICSLLQCHKFSMFEESQIWHHSWYTSHILILSPLYLFAFLVVLVAFWKFFWYQMLAFPLEVLGSTTLKNNFHPQEEKGGRWIPPLYPGWNNYQMNTHCASQDS